MDRYVIEQVEHHGPWGEPDGVSYRVMDTTDDRCVAICTHQPDAVKIVKLLNLFEP